MMHRITRRLDNEPVAAGLNERQMFDFYYRDIIRAAITSTLQEFEGEEL